MFVCLWQKASNILFSRTNCTESLLLSNVLENHLSWELGISSMKFYNRSNYLSVTKNWAKPHKQQPAFYIMLEKNLSQKLRLLGMDQQFIASILHTSKTEPNHCTGTWKVINTLVRIEDGTSWSKLTSVMLRSYCNRRWPLISLLMFLSRLFLFI